MIEPMGAYILHLDKTPFGVYRVECSAAIGGSSYISEQEVKLTDAMRRG